MRETHTQMFAISKQSKDNILIYCTLYLIYVVAVSCFFICMVNYLRNTQKCMNFPVSIDSVYKELYIKRSNKKTLNSKRNMSKKPPKLLCLKWYMFEKKMPHKVTCFPENLVTCVRIEK